MKKILNSLNQLAAEAHKAGHVSLANQISAILKTAAGGTAAPASTGDYNLDVLDKLPDAMFRAKYDEYLKLNPREQSFFLKQDPLFADRLKKGPPGPAAPASSYPYDPEVAKGISNRGQPEGPAEAISGLLKEKAKKEEVARGHEKARVMLQAIADLYKGTGKYPPFVVPAAPISGEAILAILRLANMGSKLTGWADLYKRLADLKDKTSDYLIDLEPNPFSREGVMPGSAGLVPMKDVVPPPTGETLPAGPGKGPPVAPKAKV